MPYQVREWDRYFENNKSREREHCGFVCVPNKQDGLGLAHVLSEPDGAAIYGIFQLILGALSRQCRPRAGWLTVDGHQAGTAWAPTDLALRWRRPESEIVRALEVLSSERVGWLARPECPSGARPVPAECPTTAQEEKRREGKRREEKGTSCAEPAVPASAPAATPDELRGLELYETDRKLCARWPELISAWTTACPGIDVVAEIRRAHAWEVANPTKRKRDRPRFLGSWLARAQDRNGGPHGSQTGFGAGQGGRPVGRDFAAAHIPGEADKFGGR